jgi:hypothetical protein
VSTAFFMVDVRGHYNVLLRRDWIHANECVPSTLNQCVSNKDLLGYDYISVGKDGFVLINVEKVIGATWLAHDL